MKNVKTHIIEVSICRRLYMNTLMVWTDVFNHPNNDAINSLSRQVALRNVMTLCPTLATILIDMHVQGEY